MSLAEPLIPNDSTQLARAAADGDASARRAIVEMMHPVISYQSERFCKRFCHDNRYHAICSLPHPFPASHHDAPLCEWGNASYGWMLDDLTSAKRLRRYEGKHGARINDYLYHIANSLPFYERWKDWRFGRSVHVPTYIQDLAPDANRVFLALQNGDSPAQIAQRLSFSEDKATDLVRRILCELTQRGRLHLLDKPQTVSLSQHTTDEDAAHQADIASYDEDAAATEEKRHLTQAWQQLDAVEQYVLEAMVIENTDANLILQALEKLDISIKPGLAPKDTDRQQLYYFRRKTLAKLSSLMEKN